MGEPVSVRHVPGAKRYEAFVDGQLSICTYELAGTRMVLTHTVVPPAVRGRGIAEQLVRVALADARAAGRRVVPACSYVARFIARHEEFQDLVDPA